MRKNIPFLWSYEVYQKPAEMTIYNSFDLFHNTQNLKIISSMIKLYIFRDLRQQRSNKDNPYIYATSPWPL